MPAEPECELDEKSWDEAERFWRREVEALASRIGQSGEWRSSWPKFFGDGITPLPREDRPVCDGRSWALDRGFSIWEFRRIDGEAGISAEVEDYATVFDDGGEWLDEGSPHDRVPRTHLEIRLERSEETVKLALTLLAEWMKSSTTVAEAQAFIETTSGSELW